MASPRSIESARALVDDFARRTGPGAFSRFSRAEVATGLKRRIGHADGVNQRDGYICGPAAFIHQIVEDQPAKFVRFVTELYDSGRATTYDFYGCAHYVEPGPDLRAYRPSPANKYNPADWIAMASLRDSTNWWLDYERETMSSWPLLNRIDTARGGTVESEIKDWLWSFGGYDMIRARSCYLWGEEANLMEANRLFQEGFRVFLLLHSQILNDPQTDEWATSPDHFVVLKSPVLMNSDTVTLTLWTWGYRMEHFTAPKKKFLSNYHGFIAAKF